MITLWELRGRQARPYSLFSWRTRMALKHKGLDFESRPVLMSDKPAIAFSQGKTVPIIKDGDAVVRDSWKIAEHLEDRYPDRPTLFGGPIGRGVTQAFNTWVDRALVPAMLAVIAADICDRVDAADEAYVRQMFEKFVKPAPDALKRLRRAFEPMQAALKRQPFVCGAAPAYGDYILFSVLQWARVMRPREIFAEDDPLAGWRERMLDLYDGFARHVRIG